jgi:serine/threonine-protein kinase
MSPEQLMGDELKATSDVYTLGVVAYELLTGARPFEPRTLAQLPEMQRRSQFAAPRSLRQELSENAEIVLCKALAYDPAQRYQTAFELGEVLARSLVV